MTTRKTYRPLLQLSLRHDFHTDGMASEIKFHPSSGTAALMRELDIHARDQGGKLDLFYGRPMEEGAPPALLQSAAFPLMLHFGLTSVDSGFFSYTDLPPAPLEGQLYFFTNQKPAATELSAEPPAAEESPPLTEEMRNDLPPGLPAHCWGVIELLLTDPFAAGTDEQVQPVQAYSLSFKARVTVWRYHLIDRSGIEFDELRIVSDKIAVPLSESTEGQLPDGTPTTTLVLEKPIALRERQPERFQLELSKGDGSTMPNPMLIGLPNPDPNHTKFERQDGQVMAYSDMYIYL
jgi:hypothetical protein